MKKTTVSDVDKWPTQIIVKFRRKCRKHGRTVKKAKLQGKKLVERKYIPKRLPYKLAGCWSKK